MQKKLDSALDQTRRQADLVREGNHPVSVQFRGRNHNDWKLITNEGEVTRMTQGNAIPDRNRAKEFLAAQQDPAWLAWLADMDAVVTQFVSTEFSGADIDPFTSEGLILAEARALDRWANIAEFKDPSNADLADKYIRYLGEVFVRNFGARWVNIMYPTDGRLIASGDRAPAKS